MLSQKFFDGFPQRNLPFGGNCLLHRDVRYTFTRYMQITEPTKKFLSTYRLLLRMPLFHFDESKGTWIRYFPENRGKVW